jgi:hypothetical protein
MILPSRLLAFTLPFYTAFLFSWAIPLDDDSGILYRFSPASSNETDELISWAEVRLPSLRHVKRQHIWSPFIFSLSTAAQMGSVANDPFLRRRLLPPSRYRGGRAWVPALPSAPGHQPPHGPGQEDMLVLVHA